MTKKKLSVEDFHSQFHGSEHHKDSGEYVKTKHHLINPGAAKKHKGLDLRALRNSKRKKAVVMHKDIDTMRHEMMTKRAK
jgi:hypothetical protein